MGMGGRFGRWLDMVEVLNHFSEAILSTLVDSVTDSHQLLLTEEAATVLSTSTATNTRKIVKYLKAFFTTEQS